MIGKIVSHYEIMGTLGKGGMGVVYQAKDLRLGRDVAIKVLPEEFAQNAERVARFEREAKLLASLNHPNIGAIYGLEESVGTHFLVLELVEGEVLSDQVKRGPIPVETALKLAFQITEALDAAHEKGVIHRDLKPANIKVRHDGTVKVLDFGLAKAFSGEQADLNLSNSPTLSVVATQQGIILGTAAYMPPEQARGGKADKRADIWAFGCVLYEMLTGRQAFKGEDIGEILASVIKEEVNLDLVPPNINPKVREIVRRCLQKNLKKRYRDVGDVQFELEQTLADPHGVSVQTVAAAGGQSRLALTLPWAAAVFGIVLAAAAVWILKPSPSPEPRPVTRFEYELPEDQQFSTLYERILAASPDGSRFVYAAGGGLYLRSMDELEARIIPGTEKGPQRPFFSPDGRWLGYWSSDGQLKKISISGGAPVPLTSAGSQGFLSWSTDNTIVYAGSGGIMRVSANGGTPESLVEEQGACYAPQILPDGRSVLFTVNRGDGLQIAVQSLQSKELKVLFAGDTAQYLPTGHLVYAVGNNLFAVPFDPDKLETAGGPVPVVQGVLRSGGAPQYAVSDSGTLVYVPGTSVLGRTLVWVDREGKEEPIDAPSRAYVYARLSPDGKQVALDIRDQQNDIWIWDLARKTLSRLTFDPGLNRGPVWTPDGKRLAFSAQRESAEDIYWQAADGAGSPAPLTEISKASIVPHAFSPDGTRLLFTGIASPYDVSLLKLDSGAKPERLLGTSFDEQNPHISPDGRWLAYQSNESGVAEVYVRPFPDVDTGRWQISTGGGTRPLWNPNGRELFYFIEPGTLMAVSVETGSSFTAGTPKVVFKGYYASPQTGRQYSVTPDGRRFLMIKMAGAPGSTEPAPKIIVVRNWFEELKQRAPAVP